TSRDDGRILAAEAQLATGVRDDRRPLVTQRDLRRADGEGAITVGVRDPHPQSVAAEADARIYAQRMVVESDNALRRCRRRRPVSDPMSVAWQIALHSSVPWFNPAAAVALTAMDFEAVKSPSAPGQCPLWANSGHAGRKF